MKTLSAYEFNVGTVAFWRSVAPHYGVRTWKTAMDRFAVQHGTAIAILGNDGARIVERAHMQRNGTFALIRQDLPPENVRWSPNHHTSGLES